MKVLIRIVSFSCAAVVLTACGKMRASAVGLAAQSVNSIGCKTSQSEMWSALQKIAETEQAFPSDDEVATAVRQAAQARGLKGPALDRYIQAFTQNYEVTVKGIASHLAPHDVEGWKKALAQMEIGIRVTPIHAELQDQISGSLKKLSQAEAALQAACPNPDQPIATPTPPTNSGTVWDQLKAAQNPEVYGARRVLATAYQSCSVLNLPPMTNSTPDVQGIEVTGTHSSGAGLTRAIASLAQVVASDYYIKGQTLAKNTCFEIRNAPMIYDFGGKPYTTSSQPQILDFFKNGGSGTSVLGIDCSAFVFSALATAGLKMDPDPAKVLKADLVQGIGSSAFKEPQSNGLRCLNKISVSAAQSILPGDIVAINGHVVMIDTVGADPFGLGKITQLSDCTAAKLPVSRFDFGIAQSAPVKNGIGINRYKASEYVATSSTFTAGLQAYAVAACKAKFGGSAAINSPNLSVVRHAKTPECMTEPLQLNNDDCISSCPAL